MAITDTVRRQRAIYRVTLWGGVVNTVLLAVKFAAGVAAGSAAMIADAVHSLSDFLTDVVVMVFVKLGSKPEDCDHEYGHGKYETLATAVIGLSLLLVGAYICCGGVGRVAAAWRGERLEVPGAVALWAALASIVLKEWAYRFTAATGRRVGSQAVVANAWHHRSDALSSVGTALGIGGAIALGERWAVLDPIAAVVVSLFVMHTAWSLTRGAVGELLEQSLPADVEREIVAIADQEPCVSRVHHLRTRRIGNNVAINMHVRMPGDMTLSEAHAHATAVEQRLRRRFGPDAIVTLHVEPLRPGNDNAPAGR